MMERRGILIAGSALLLSGGTAFAQSNPTPARLRGKVDSVSGDSLSLTLRDGTKGTAQLANTTRVTWLLPAQIDQIQQGSYIGTAAVSQPDGTLKALEVQVFPPSMHGVGEGTRDWDVAPGSSMTNGTVGNLVAANGRTITITYKGGEKRVFVPEGVPVVTYEATDRSAIQPGTNVLVNGMRQADGTIVATSVSVGKNGLVPPM